MTKFMMRTGVFETNSSSVHSFTIMSPEQLEDWKSGKLCWDSWNEELLTPDEAERYADDINPVSYDDFYDETGEMSGFTTSVTECITPGGEKIVVASYYGYA